MYHVWFPSFKLDFAEEVGTSVGLRLILFLPSPALLLALTKCCYL